MTQAIRTTTTAIALIALFVSLAGTGLGASQFERRGLSQSRRRREQR
jgi:hypothetical protein